MQAEEEGLAAAVAFERTPLAWDEAVDVEGSSGGSGGVFFATFRSGLRVAVKGSGEAAREVYATRVLRRLRLAAPACRLLLFENDEYQALKARLAALSEKKDEGELRHRILKSLNRPTILVYQFSPGRSALEVPPGDAAWSDARLAQRLGALLAADVALNNLDRLPLPALWDNAGNLGNVLLRDDGIPVPVDSSCFCVRAEVSGRVNPLLQRHMGRLGALLAEVAGCGEGAESGAVAGVRRVLLECGVELDAAAGAMLQRGLVAGLTRIAGLERGFWGAERAAVAAMVPREADWENCWARDLALVELPFLEAVHALVATHFGQKQ